MDTISVQVPVKTHDDSLDVVVDGTIYLPSIYERLAQKKQWFLPLMDSPQAIEADTMFQLRGMCDAEYTETPIIYQVIMQFPRMMEKLTPRSRIGVYVTPDTEPDSRGPQGLCDADPNYRGYLSRTFGSMRHHNSYLMPVSRSARQHISDDFINKDAIDFSNAKSMRRILDSRAWLRFSDTIEVARVSPRHDYQIIPPTSVRRLIASQYQHVSRLYAEEKMLVKYFGEIRDDGEVVTNKRGIYVSAETERAAIREHSKRAGN